MSEYVRVVTSDEPVPSPPAAPALVTGYEPDRFQKFAIDAIEAGDNVLCLAKTGSGKTFVGEYQIAKSLQRGGRIFYTTPIKSLSNQKFNDLKKLFPQASVGIMTGDIKFRPDAQIIVMTTEILRNLLFKKGTATENVGITALLSLDGLDSVIFDEVHYINDIDRGHVWEECLILLPPAIKLILLSATLSSPYGFAKWLGITKKVRIWLISTLWRAVPLEHCVLGGSGGGAPLVIYDSKETFRAEVYRDWLNGRNDQLLAYDKFKEKVRSLKQQGQEGAISGKVKPKAFEHTMNECLGNLYEKGNLPAIVFVFSRAGCEKLADKVEHTFIDSSDAAAVSHIWDFHLSRYESSLAKSPQAHILKSLAMRGIAFHHSGLLPFMKEILEILFSRGLCKVLFATETFAVGINMPTKTVIFTALDKFTDGSMRLLKPAEYIQMAGRAGRRGKDDRGLVIYLPQREPVSVAEMQSIVTGKAATFGSRLNFGYDFLLKLANSSQITESSLLENSYWWALQQYDAEQAKKELENLTQQVSQIQLTPEEKEECASYRNAEIECSQSQNAKKKSAQRALAAWKDNHRESIWKPILARYDTIVRLEKEISGLKSSLSPENDVCNIPGALLRRRVLEEFGYVKEGVLTPLGLLASEVNEGHPFLMTELFQNQSVTKTLSCKELLTVLALFAGASDSKDDSRKSPDDLRVSSIVRDELWRINDAVKECQRLEAKHRVLSPDTFWSLSTEWIEPIADWLEGEITVSELAAKYEMFEGNVLKGLMKLSGLLEEFQSMASVSGNLEWLAELVEARQLVLRDVVIAESLYLRI
jgi:superfamily II RNA helicase